MRKNAVLFTVALLLFLSSRLASQSPPPENTPGSVSFSRDVHPLLINQCIGCHAGESAMSGLRLSTVEGLLKGGQKAGPAVLPGQADESPLIQYLNGVRQPRMPFGAEALPPEQVEMLRSWIAAGAPDDSGGPVPAHLPSAGPADELFDESTFSADPEQALIQRRTRRLALLPAPPQPPQVSQPAHNDIDRFIISMWERQGLPEALKPPPLCDDQTFMRRVYLDILGLLPTSREARSFSADSDPRKRDRLIDRLLDRKEHYAAHWTPFWEEALASATTTSRGGIPTHGDYHDWIFENLLKNEPYDVMVAELIDPAMPGHQSTVREFLGGQNITISFILNYDHKSTLQSAANVGQVFLGTGMKCASCHNHCLNQEWPQARFLGFAGLFAPTDLEMIRCEKSTGQLVPTRFPFDLPGVSQHAPEKLPERLRRAALLITDPANPRFARTIVNRLWKRYMGLGLVEPVDDFRQDRSPSHPELLDWLAHDFMAHGFDLKHTTRRILSSRVYQLAYNPALADSFDSEKEPPRYFRSPALRRLTAEQLIDGIQLVTGQRLPLEQRVFREKASTALTRALGRPADRMEVTTLRPESVSVIQALEVLNGEEFHELSYFGDLLRQVGALTTPRAQLDELYWAALGRPPRPEEIDAALGFLQELERPSAGKAAIPVEEIWLDDELPDGARAKMTGEGQIWEWASAPSPVHRGERAHWSSDGYHSFERAEPPLKVGPGALLFAYVYLDPEAPPRGIAMDWQQRDKWRHRVYWGAPEEGTGPAGRHMGPLPPSGRWVRLEIPAEEAGLYPRHAVTGWAFQESGGKAYWDEAGVVRQPEDPALRPLGDLLWALFSGPAFQYIY